MELWPQPFWAGGLDKLFEWVCTDFSVGGSVVFLACMVFGGSNAALQLEDAPPVVLFFSGSGSPGGLDGLKLEAFKQASPRSFVLVAPCRPTGIWWSISDEHQWGWCDGDFLPMEVRRLALFAEVLQVQHGVAKRRLSAVGFSAGAYLVTELMAEYEFRSIVLGGVHGHGQPDLEGIEGVKRKAQGDVIVAKWHIYS